MSDSSFNGFFGGGKGTQTVIGKDESVLFYSKGINYGLYQCPVTTPLLCWRHMWWASDPLCFDDFRKSFE
jgi:hypothetical protein